VIYILVIIYTRQKQTKEPNPKIKSSIPVGRQETNDSTIYLAFSETITLAVSGLGVGISKRSLIMEGAGQV